MLLKLVIHPKLFPLLMCVMQLCACLICLYNKDYKRAMYWLGGFIITVAITI